MCPQVCSRRHGPDAVRRQSGDRPPECPRREHSCRLRGPRAGQGTGAAGPLSGDKGRAREWPSLAQSLLRAREHCVRGVAFSSVRCTSACHLFNPRGHRPEHCEVEVRRRLGGVRLVGTGGVGDWAGRAALAQGRRAGPAHPGVREDGRGKGRPRSTGLVSRVRFRGVLRVPSPLLGPAGVPCTEHRVTGNPASTLWLSPTPSVQAAYPWTGRGCVRRRATPLSCRSRACLGSAGAGAGAPLSGRAGCCASGSQSCFPDGCPAGSLCTQECGERGPATPPHPPPATQLGFPTPAPASAPSGAQWDPC